MKDMTLTAFLELTGSDAPAPGGGSISALAGALAAALTEMVARLTLGKKKYAAVAPEMKAALAAMLPLRSQLLDAVEEDSKSFDRYMLALSLPKDTPEEQAARKAAMEEGLRAAVRVPLHTAELAGQVFPAAKAMVVRGNATAVTDALVAAMLARTAVLGALYNVKINLLSLPRDDFFRETAKRTAELEQAAQTAEHEILALAPQLNTEELL